MIPEVLSRLPDVDKLRSEAGNRTLTPYELLALQSRSFSPAITHLSMLKGKSEVDKGVYVQDFYNILRALDNGGEDNNLSVPVRQKVIDRLVFLVNELCQRSPDDVDALLKGEEAQYVANKMIEAALDNDERIFAEHFGRGGVWKEFNSFDPRIREVVKNSVSTMAAGMKKYLGKSLQTEDELRNYCYYVASSVGDGLSGIVHVCDETSPFSAELGRAFGEVLQLTNILKNAGEDFKERNIAYVPREFFSDIETEELFNESGDKVTKARENVRSRIYKLVQGAIPKAVAYILSIDPGLTGYKACCLSPLIAAIETWKTMNDAGPDDVFANKPEAVKIDKRQFMCVLEFTEQIVRKGKANEWLNCYGDDPDRFSFKEGAESYCFNNWLPRWTNGSVLVNSNNTGVSGLEQEVLK